MTRFLVAACCVLVHLSAEAQFFQRPPRAKPPAGGNCGARQGAVCQINAQVFDFGRGQMGPNHAAINAENTISVTCTRSPELEGVDVLVDFYLSARPGEPSHHMRDRHLLYLRYYMFVDPTRTRHWGTGSGGATFTFPGTLQLDNRNRVGTLAYRIYGQVDGNQGQSPPGQWLGLLQAHLEYQVSCN
jgi:spore coat protein U-like protein